MVDASGAPACDTGYVGLRWDGRSTAACVAIVAAMHATDHAFPPSDGAAMVPNMVGATICYGALYYHAVANCMTHVPSMCVALHILTKALPLQLRFPLESARELGSSIMGRVHSIPVGNLVTKACPHSLAVFCATDAFFKWDEYMESMPSMLVHHAAWFVFSCTATMYPPLGSSYVHQFTLVELGTILLTLAPIRALPDAVWNAFVALFTVVRVLMFIPAVWQQQQHVFPDTTGSHRDVPAGAALLNADAVLGIAAVNVYWWVGIIAVTVKRYRKPAAPVAPVGPPKTE